MMHSKDYFIVEEDFLNTHIADGSQITVIERSRGTGPDGNARLVLVRGHGT